MKFALAHTHRIWALYRLHSFRAKYFVQARSSSYSGWKTNLASPPCNASSASHPHMHRPLRSIVPTSVEPISSQCCSHASPPRKTWSASYPHLLNPIPLCEIRPRSYASLLCVLSFTFLSSIYFFRSCSIFLSGSKTNHANISRASFVSRLTQSTKWSTTRCGALSRRYLPLCVTG